MTDNKKSLASSAEERVRRVMRRLVALVAVVALICVCVAVWHTLTRYTLYNGHEAYLPSAPVFEAGRAFEPLADEAPMVEGMVLAAENEALKLYVDPQTAEIAVYDKRNGEVIRSNPADAADDKKANATNKDYLRSQLVVDYYNTSRVSGTYATASMSVDRGQMTMEAIENGVRFTYGMGEIPVIEFYVPYYLTTEWYDKIIASVDEKDAKSFARMYRLEYGVNGMYGLLEGARTSRKSQKNIDEILQKAGFTPEDYEIQQALGGIEPEEYQFFTVPLEYRLDGDSLVVTVPISQITEQGGSRIYNIHLLRAFGAAGGEEDGYIVVPNGSGALIRFNSGKTNVPAYSQYIYEMDPLEAEYISTQYTEPVRLPIFGLCREKSGILATVESGESYACIKADVSGRLNSYNTAYVSFGVRGFSSLSMFGVAGKEAELPVVEDEMYTEDLSVRYTFLTEEYTGYSGLARAYRERLMTQGALVQKTEQRDIPFYYDVIGGVEQTKHMLGIAYRSIYPMTTFAQAVHIAQELKTLGIGNQVMNLQGWFDGGYYHDMPERFGALKQLGGKDAMEQLCAAVRRMGGEVYADVAFQQVSDVAKGYSIRQESSRYYASGYSVYLGRVHPTTLRNTASLGYQEIWYNLISPRYLTRYVDSFAEEIQKYDMDGISLRDLGRDLHSDKRRTKFITREAALSIVDAQLEKLAATGKKLMVSGGNAYALDGAAHIINAPMEATEFFIIDQEIPLYQMILHGCVDYTGTTYNLASTDNWDREMLKMIEYGASCHYTFSQASATEMKQTGMFMFYATKADHWLADAAETYHRLNEYLALVSNALMQTHERLEHGVVRVSYSNGITIYVNYGDTAVEVGGLTVPAMGAAMGGAAR